MLMKAMVVSEPVRETLHFIGSSDSLPATYNCTAVRSSEDRLFFYAEKQPALDDEQAKEYALINSELAVVTRQLQRVNHSLASEITERKLVQEVLAQVAERDRRIAEVLQHAMMPSQIPLQPPGYEIAIKYQPMSPEADVCGDFCDVFDLGEGRIGISIGDIVGKGLLAAIRVTAVMNTIRSYAYLYNQPSKVVALANDAFCRDTTHENDMLTAFYSILDTSNGTLTYTNAGHEPPLLCSVSGEIKPLRSGGLMFCGITQQEYLEECINFQDGDIFVAVTDGITEASVSKRSEQYSSEGIIRTLLTNPDDAAESISSKILDDATTFANGALNDDAIIVLIKKVRDSQ
jgi:sigma-B regulation protein RsbU (phosphoserine phosphatase)